MSGIKITAADRYFSLCIRERADNTCEKCGATDTKLENSHFHSRRHRGLRFDPNNCCCLCFVCHQFLGGDPPEHVRFFTGLMGEGMIDILRDKKNSIFKLQKGELKEIAAFYRQELKLLREARDNGETGYLDFGGWY